MSLLGLRSNWVLAWRLLRVPVTWLALFWFYNKLGAQEGWDVWHVLIAICVTFIAIRS